VIGDVRSGLFGFARQIAGGLSRASGWVFGKHFAAQGYGSQGDCNLTKPTLPEPRHTGQPFGVVNSFEGGLVGVLWLSKKGIVSTSVIVRKLIVSVAQLQL
jgi:hypothetical protein